MEPSRWEVLRLVTPALIALFGGLNLWVVSDLREKVSALDQKVYAHQVNEELHLPRAEMVRLEVRLDKKLDTLQSELIQVIKSRSSR